MSSTNGKGKNENDFYPTPVEHVNALMSKLAVRSDDMFLEPCYGTGVISKAVPLPSIQKSWAEIRQGVDYLTATFRPMDLIITNPPFSLAEEFFRKALSELQPDGTLAMLQRVNFLGSIQRLNFWREVGFPDKTPVLVPRPRFSGGGSDSCEYQWFIYDRGNRFPTIPKGTSHIVAWELIKGAEFLT